MTEYIDRIHFDERVRVAVGIAESDFTEDFKDGVLFVLELLKSEETADVIERSKVNKAIEELQKEIEENHLNVIEYADGEWIVKDFVYGAIERFKRNIGE